MLRRLKESLIPDDNKELSSKDSEKCKVPIKNTTRGRSINELRGREFRKRLQNQTEKEMEMQSKAEK